MPAPTSEQLHRACAHAGHIVRSLMGRLFGEGEVRVVLLVWRGDDAATSIDNGTAAELRDIATTLREASAHVRDLADQREMH